MHRRVCPDLSGQAGVWPERPAGRSGLKGRPGRPGWPSETLALMDINDGAGLCHAKIDPGKK